MQDFPHHYRIEAAAGPEGDVSLMGEGLETMPSAPPPQFGGPGDRWSPESLLVASVASCFILSFRAVARASKLEWASLRCEVEGRLERQATITRFTELTVTAALHAPPETNVARARRVMEKAEATCLITNSLSCPIRLDAKVIETD